MVPRVLPAVHRNEKGGAGCKRKKNSSNAKYYGRTNFIAGSRHGGTFLPQSWGKHQSLRKQLPTVGTYKSKLIQVLTKKALGKGGGDESCRVGPIFIWFQFWIFTLMQVLASGPMGSGSFL